MCIFNGRGVFNYIRQYAMLLMLMVLFGIMIFAQTNRMVNSDSKSFEANYSASTYLSGLLKNEFNQFGQKQDNKQVLVEFCIPLPNGGVICF